MLVKIKKDGKDFLITIDGVEIEKVEVEPIHMKAIEKSKNQMRNYRVASTMFTLHERR